MTNDPTTLHGIPNCDTVKKARAWLADRNVSYEFRDFKKAPPSTDEITRWASVVGWERLLNRQGTTFRKLPEPDKAGLDEKKAVALMVAHPSAIKRPVVKRDGQVTVGFDLADWDAQGLAKPAG